nr:methyl-accepting chemotaxis protein [uncultured Cohaesibacter sp.]
MSVEKEITDRAGGRGHKKGRKASKSMHWLKRLKIGHRIFIGFLVVIAVLNGVSFFAAQALNKLDTNFERYGDFAGDSIIATELQTQLVELQLSAREYLAQPSKKNVDRFKQRYDDLQQLLATAHDEIEDPARVKLLESIDFNVEDYDIGFDTLVALMNKRNELVNKTLAEISDDIDTKIDAIDNTIANSLDLGLSIYAVDIRESMLLARVNLMKFIDDGKEDSLAAASSHLDALRVAVRKIRDATVNEDLKTALIRLSSRVDDYKSMMASLQNTIAERNMVREQTLDTRATEILTASREIVSTVSSDSAAVEATVKSNFKSTTEMLILATIVSVLVGIGCALLISRGITKPLLAITAAMKQLAAGQLDLDVPGKERGDEIGEMSVALEVFKQNALRTKELEQTQEENQRRAEVEKRAMMGKMADDFNEHIGGIIDTVSNASEELSSNAQAMADVSEQTEKQVSEASVASAQTSGNVQTVATATEEMTSTIGEISLQVQQASGSARDAVHKVDATNQMMEMLAHNSNKIGEVVEMISKIAEQTNLLALNATIESARAGEAGKGFAVVAGEVKALAGQTAKATDEIALQINEIQSATEKASLSMNDVSQVIQRLDEFTATIASAMEQQNAATSEISSSIHQAAQGTEIVDNSINSVSKASQEASQASSHVMVAARELAKQSDFLKSEVQSFISHVREG